ncbi:energy transducer TonB [Glaciimonas immobilis]|uniref:Protein TonB n=1 Tax=Glaciimonas immobilis TaxID=728004 RepID=A0A840RYN3_9BURK|nr:energy transducer TonB [Glaciimonas immobilis]MBB5201489.1 protein TonB [Glaciimonas immobilis]
MSSPSQLPSTFVWNQVKRIGPLGAIILLHAGFFIALKSGLIHTVAQAMPKEVFATFITPERAPEPTPPKPQPAPPKTVHVVKKSIAPPRPAPVIVNNTPSEQAISVPVTVQPPQKEEYSPPAPAPVAAPAAPAAPRTISTGVEYIRAPSPEYPAAAKRMGEEGKVILRVLINEKGRAEHVEIQKSSGSGRLDEAARQALQRALFKPYMEDGKALPVYAIVPINFQLSN